MLEETDEKQYFTRLAGEDILFSVLHPRHTSHPLAHYQYYLDSPTATSADNRRATLNPAATSGGTTTSSAAHPLVYLLSPNPSGHSGDLPDINFHNINYCLAAYAKTQAARQRDQREQQKTAAAQGSAADQPSALTASQVPPNRTAPFPHPAGCHYDPAYLRAVQGHDVSAHVTQLHGGIGALVAQAGALPCSLIVTNFRLLVLVATAGDATRNYVPPMWTATAEPPATTTTDASSPPPDEASSAPAANLNAARPWDFSDSDDDGPAKDDAPAPSLEALRARHHRESCLCVIDIPLMMKAHHSTSSISAHITNINNINPLFPLSSLPNPAHRAEASQAIPDIAMQRSLQLLHQSHIGVETKVRFHIIKIDTKYIWDFKIGFLGVPGAACGTAVASALSAPYPPLLGQAMWLPALPSRSVANAPNTTPTTAAAASEAAPASQGGASSTSSPQRPPAAAGWTELMQGGGGGSALQGPPAATTHGGGPPSNPYGLLSPMDFTAANTAAEVICSKLDRLLASLSATELRHLPAFEHHKEWVRKENKALLTAAVPPSAAEGGASFHTDPTAGTSAPVGWTPELDFGWSVFQEEREFERQLTVDSAAPVPQVEEFHNPARAGPGVDLRPWFRVTSLTPASGAQQPAPTTAEGPVEGVMGADGGGKGCSGCAGAAWPMSPHIAGYTPSPTYPLKICVPAAASDRFLLEECVPTRSRGRIPAISFVHLRTGAVLARASQPLNKKNTSPDEKLCKYLHNHYTTYSHRAREEHYYFSSHTTAAAAGEAAEAGAPAAVSGTGSTFGRPPPNIFGDSPAKSTGSLRPPPSLFDDFGAGPSMASARGSVGPTAHQGHQPASGPSSACLRDARIASAIVATGPQFLNVIDCRPKAAAVANDTLGGGYEKYNNCRVKFFAIENIHAVTSAFAKLRHAIHALTKGPCLGTLQNYTAAPFSSTMAANVQQFITAFHMQNKHLIASSSSSTNSSGNTATWSTSTLSPSSLSAAAGIATGGTASTAATTTSVSTSGSGGFSGSRNNEHMLQLLADSSWYTHVQRVLFCGAEVAAMLDRGESCLVHCTDGWDRTSQVTALAMLLLDPYYRTLRGFCCLIEKEFCAFGHKFAERIGHMLPGTTTFNADSGVSASDTESSSVQQQHKQQPSPIFLQFLDCLYQVLAQHPAAFEFTPKVLEFLAEHVYSCLYGTFLANNQQERIFEGITTGTVSVWSDLLLAAHLERLGRRPPCLLQPSFDSKRAAKHLLRRTTSRDNATLFRAPVQVVGTSGAGGPSAVTSGRRGAGLPSSYLQLNTTSKALRFWSELYLRYDPDEWLSPTRAGGSTGAPKHSPLYSNIVGLAQRREADLLLPVSAASFAPWLGGQPSEQQQQRERDDGGVPRQHPAFVQWNADEIHMMRAHRGLEYFRHSEIRARYLDARRTTGQAGAAAAYAVAAADGEDDYLNVTTSNPQSSEALGRSQPSSYSPRQSRLPSTAEPNEDGADSQGGSGQAGIGKQVGTSDAKKCWICRSSFNFFSTKHYCCECRTRAPICNNCSRPDPRTSNLRGPSANNRLCLNCYKIVK